MAERFRQRYADLRTGSRIRSDGNGDLEQITSRVLDEVWDITGPGDGDPFTVEHHVRQGGEINGTTVSGTKFTNYMPDRFATMGSSFYGTGLPSGRPTNGSLMTQLLARTNPSRPVVDLPVFVAELGDVPKLIRLAGGSILRKVAGANLTWRFGWAPLISDLNSMLDFSAIVDKRTQELKRLSEKGLRRKLHLWSGTFDSQDTGESLQSLNGTVTGTIRRAVIQRIDGFVEWVMSSDNPTTGKEMRQLARRAVLGLTIDPATAWELIPFSWLIDWSGNVGQFLMSRRNLVGATPRQKFLTELTVRNSVVTTTSTSSGLRTNGDHHYGWTRKKRIIASATLSAQLPYLSKGQLSILGSLAVLRHRKPGKIAFR